MLMFSVGFTLLEVQRRSKAFLRIQWDKMPPIPHPDPKKKTDFQKKNRFFRWTVPVWIVLVCKGGVDEHLGWDTILGLLQNKLNRTFGFLKIMKIRFEYLWISRVVKAENTVWRCSFVAGTTSKSPQLRRSKQNVWPCRQSHWWVLWDCPFQLLGL